MKALCTESPIISPYQEWTAVTNGSVAEECAMRIQIVIDGVTRFEGHCEYVESDTELDGTEFEVFHTRDDADSIRNTICLTPFYEGGVA